MKPPDPELTKSRSYKTLILVIGQGVNALVSFLFFPYLARALSVENYGTYGQVLLVCDLAKVFFIMGLTNIIYIQFSDKSNKTGSVFKSNLFFSFASGLFATILLFCLSDSIGLMFENNAMINFVKILSISLLFQIPSDYLNAVLIYFNKIKQSAFLLVITNLVKITLLVISIHYFKSTKMVYYSFTLVSLCQLLLSFLFIPRESVSSGRIERKIVRTQLFLSLPLIFSGIMGYLLKFIDGLIVSSLLTVKDFALFRNGAFEIPLISIVYSSVSAVTLPELSKLNSQQDINGIVSLKQKATSSVALFTIPVSVFMLFFSTPVITVLFGETYAGSSVVFLIVNLLVLLRINDYQDILLIKSYTKFILLYNIICLLFNIALSYILILYFGIAGAAAATTVSIYLFAFLLLKKSTTILKTSLFSFFEPRILFPVFTISILTSLALYWCFTFMNNNNMIFPLGIAYLIIVYAVFYKLRLLDLPIVNELLRKFNLKRV